MSESLIGLPWGILVGMESLALPLSLCHEMTAARRKKKAMGEIPPMAFDYDLRLKKENLQAPGSLGN
jgi:hypothetical protein